MSEGHDNAFSAYFPKFIGPDLMFEERLWTNNWMDFQIVDVVTQVALEALTGRSVEPRVHKRSVPLPFSIDEMKTHGHNGAQVLWSRLLYRIEIDCRFAGEAWAQTVWDAQIHDGGPLPDDWGDDGEIEDLAENAAGPLWRACSDEEQQKMTVHVQNGAAGAWRKLQRRGK